MATFPVIERVIDQINTSTATRDNRSAQAAVKSAMDAGLINHDDYSIDWQMVERLSPHIKPQRRMTLMAFLVGVDGT